MSSEQEISNIDEEILELEELIALQRRKVQLLRKKHEANSSSGGNRSDADGPPKEKESTQRKSFTLNPVQSMQMGEATDKIPDEESGPAPTTPVSPRTKQESLISSMQRMSRLSTDLANERNLLAWGRTALAAARTALAFLGLTGTTSFGDAAVYMTSIGFGVLAVWMVLQGGARYKRIKEILMLPEPPLYFGRISNVPIHVVMLALLILLVIGNSADQWSK